MNQVTADDERGLLPQPIKVLEIEITHVDGDAYRYMYVTPGKLPLTMKEREKLQAAIKEATDILAIGVGRQLAAQDQEVPHEEEGHKETAKQD